MMSPRIQFEFINYSSKNRYALMDLEDADDNMRRSSTRKRLSLLLQMNDPDNPPSRPFLNWPHITAEFCFGLVFFCISHVVRDSRADMWIKPVEDFNPSVSSNKNPQVDLHLRLFYVCKF